MSRYESEPGVPPVRIRRLRAARWKRETLLRQADKLVVAKSDSGPAEWTYAALIEISSDPSWLEAEPSPTERYES